MAITIGPNYISSNTSDINLYSGSSYVGTVNSTSGRKFSYPSFNARCTYNGWRYAGQMGGQYGWRQTSQWGVNGYWSVNQRSPGSYGFNTTFGRYYAPVSGYYQFGMTLYHLRDQDWNSQYTHINFGKNGGLNYNNSRHGHSIFGHENSSGSYSHGCNMENIIYLSQGQYVSPHPYWARDGMRVYLGHFHFYGYLCP